MKSSWTLWPHSILQSRAQYRSFDSFKPLTQEARDLMQTRENVYLRDETADDNSGAIFSYYSPTIKGIIAASVVGEPAMMMGNSVSE